MPEFVEIVKTRRSIRKYEDRNVPPEPLDSILEAVRWSPSWANTQCWEIVVVRDPAVKQQLQATLPPKGNPAAGAMLQAPVSFPVGFNIKVGRSRLMDAKGFLDTRGGAWLA